MKQCVDPLSQDSCQGDWSGSESYLAPSNAAFFGIGDEAVPNARMFPSRTRFTSVLCKLVTLHCFSSYLTHYNYKCLFTMGVTQELSLNKNSPIFHVHV